MNNLKRILGILLAAVLLVSSVFALSACDGDNGGESGGESGGNQENTKITYTVNVKAGTAGVAGVSVVFEKDGKKQSPTTTDENGVAKLELDADAEIAAYITAVPTAYKSYLEEKPITTKYTFTDKTLTVTLAEEVVKEAYTIYVVDASGAPVAGVQVQICEKESGKCLVPKTTDADGKAVYEVEAGSGVYQAQLTSDTSSKTDFDSNNEITLTVN